jgi:regulator of cell morphogenesis and NO signaling
MPARVDRIATVAQIVAEHGATAAVFRRYEIDFCCRGDATVLESCRERHLDAEEVLAQLERVISAAEIPHEDRRGSSVVTHIVEHHHAHERGALPYIVSLLAKVTGRYRRRDGRLDALCDVGQDLADTLEAYMDVEERTLFPALAKGGCEIARGEMSRHNRELFLLLGRIRALADGYVAPEWADRDYRALIEELEALEESVVERMHVENHVLVGAEPPRRRHVDEPEDRPVLARAR